MEKSEKQLKETVIKLFTDKKIDVLIGFENGTLPFRSRPCMIRSVDKVDNLVWNSTCSNNLTVYLVDFFRPRPASRNGTPYEPPKVGIVVKGCDALSIAVLVKENQVLRENLVVIGMPCKGIIDPVTQEIIPSCSECRNPVPEGVDILIEGDSRKPAPEGYGKITEFEAKPIEERWQYFTEQMSKCIRCYACRQACPNCYCNECFAEQTKPKWIGVSNDLSDTMLYQLGRMFHQAGRCVGCDACVRACPMNVDLRLFTQKLAKDAKDLFDYDTSELSKKSPLLCTFNHDDTDNFITDPEKQD